GKHHRAGRPPPSSRKYFPSDIKEDGRCRRAGLKHPDTPRLFDNEEPAAAIVGVSHIERTRKSRRHHRFERVRKGTRAGILREKIEALRSGGGFLPQSNYGTTADESPKSNSRRFHDALPGSGKIGLVSPLPRVSA